MFLPPDSAEFPCVPKESRLDEQYVHAGRRRSGSHCLRQQCGFRNGGCFRRRFPTAIATRHASCISTGDDSSPLGRSSDTKGSDGPSQRFDVLRVLADRTLCRRAMKA